MKYPYAPIYPRRWALILLSFDICMVFLHLVTATWGVGGIFFHLDYEQNAPTAYQAAKLICFGSYLFCTSWQQKYTPQIKWFLIPLSVALVALGFDELLQIHENMYRIFEYLDLLHPSRIIALSMKMGYRSSLWILYYVPIICLFVFWSGYWLSYFQQAMRHNARLLFLSSGSLFVVLLAEILSSTGSFSPSDYFWLVTVEELAEMVLATSLVYLGLKLAARQYN